MYKIGLTGGICTGKTFILNIFKELECYTIRADDIARNIIFSNNSEILKEIIKVFGEDIYDEKNGLKKEKFTRLLFEDQEKRNFSEWLKNVYGSLPLTEPDIFLLISKTH